MTREGLLKHWDVICAFKDGERIQFRDATMVYWDDCGSPDFSETVEYRIKPEPREWWEVRSQNSKACFGIFDDLKSAKRYLPNEERGSVFHVREVIE